MREFEMFELDDGLAADELEFEGFASGKFVAGEQELASSIRAVSRPKPGRFYKFKRGDTLLGVAGRAYGLPAGSRRMKAAQRINESTYNHRFWSSRLASRSFPRGRISLNPRFSCSVANQAAVTGAAPRGRCFATIWVPIADTKPKLPDNVPVLRRGARSGAVAFLQNALNKWPKLRSILRRKLRLDGSFGSSTLRGVRAFQRSVGLRSDGVVGPQTWRRLFTAVGAPLLRLRQIRRSELEYQIGRSRSRTERWTECMDLATFGLWRPIAGQWSSIKTAQDILQNPTVLAAISQISFVLAEHGIITAAAAAELAAGAAVASEVILTALAAIIVFIGAVMATCWAQVLIGIL